jgi:hypothetical protein
METKPVVVLPLHFWQLITLVVSDVVASTGGAF